MPLSVEKSFGSEEGFSGRVMARAVVGEVLRAKGQEREVLVLELGDQQGVLFLLLLWRERENHVVVWLKVKRRR
uniref:S-adenosylmethionine-dependent methyltransferase n=1 Tax=Rhizophora mucronata TaxID=61149 RepID=A0A2P2L6M6_RHIMU